MPVGRESQANSVGTSHQAAGSVPPMMLLTNGKKLYLGIPNAEVYRSESNSGVKDFIQPGDHVCYHLLKRQPLPQLPGEIQPFLAYGDCSCY